MARRGSFVPPSYEVGRIFFVISLVAIEVVEIRPAEPATHPFRGRGTRGRGDSGRGRQGEGEAGRGGDKERVDLATLPNFGRRWQSSRSLKLLAEWKLCHGQSVFATLPHSLK